MYVLREPLVGENAVAEMILNGLVRVTRNRKGVDVNGNPVRYQWGAFDRMQNEWAICRQFGWYRRSLRAFAPIIRGEGFFYWFFTSCSCI